METDKNVIKTYFINEQQRQPGNFHLVSFQCTYFDYLSYTLRKKNKPNSLKGLYVIYCLSVCMDEKCLSWFRKLLKSRLLINSILRWELINIMALSNILLKGG